MQTITECLIGLLVLCACAVSSAKAEIPRVHLCPEPREIRLLAKFAPLDASQGLVVYNLSGSKTAVGPAVSRLANAVRRQQTPAKAMRVVVGSVADWSSEKTLAKLSRDLRLPEDDIDTARSMPADGYFLRAKEDRVWIVGKDARGTAYGVETLAELVRTGKLIPAMEIRDWPATKFRAAYTTDLPADQFRNLIDTLFRYKLNYVVIEANLYYKLSDPEIAKRVKEDFDYCRSVGIEPIPEIQSFGWGTAVLEVDPTCAEAVPWKDRPMAFGPDDLAIPPDSLLATTATIANPGFELGQGNQFAGWTDIDQGLSTGTGQDGSRCALLTREYPGMARIAQTFEVIPHRMYELSLDMKTEAGPDYVAYFEIYEGAQMLDAAQRQTTTTGWERRTMRFKAGESTSVTVYLRIGQGVGKAWFDNVECHTTKPLDLVNLIVERGQPFVVKSVDSKTTYREGEDYKLTPGKLAPYPYKPAEAVPWKLTRIPSGRIPAGATVLTTCDWVPEDSITYCPSERRTQQIMRKAITQTMRLVKPKYLHIGHDEPRIINRDGRCKSRNMRAHEIFTEDVRRLRQYARSIDPKVRIMMWADVLHLRSGNLLPFAFESTERCTFDEAVKLIPKDVVMCGWWYDPVGGDRNNELAWLSAISDPLIKAGFDTTISPWFDLANTYYWGEVARKSEASDKFLGLFLTTWGNRWAALPLCADLMWNPDLPTYPPDADTNKIKELAAERDAGFELPEFK